MEGYWIIRTYEAGPVGEKIKFFIPGEKPTRSERKLRADAKKVQENERATERRAARIINANFTAGDLFIGLDYSERGYQKLVERAKQMREAGNGGPLGTAAPTEEDQGEGLEELIYLAAERELQNFIRRVKRACPEAKLFCVTADMDGKTGELVRVHHHLIVSRDAGGAVLEKWTAGGVDVEQLSDQPDYTPVAAYMLKQVRKRANGKAYTRTRNMVEPQPKDRVAMNGSEVRPPKGASVIYRGTYTPGLPQYVRYIIKRRC